MFRHVLLFSLFLSGCGGSLPQPETPTAVQAVVAPALSAAGDKAVITLAVYPARLQEFVGQAGFLEPVLQALVDQYAAGAAVFDAWVSDVTGRFHEGEVGSVLEWPGIDLSRPIYFRVGEAPDDLPSALAVLSGAPSPLRHVLACPATDASALQGHFESLFANCPVSGGLRQCRGHQVQIVHNADWVFIVRNEGPMPALDASELMAPADPLADWAYHSGPVSGFLRPTSLRGVAAHLGAAQASSALGSADAESAHLMRTMAASEIVGAYLRSSTYGIELERVAFFVHPSPLALSFRASLSESGARYSQVPVGEANREGNAESGVLIRTGYDLNALLAARHPFAYPTEERQMNEAMRSCGMSCGLRALFEPSAYFSFLLGGSSRAVALGANAELEVDPSLEAGSLDVDVDTSRVPGARAGGLLSVRSHLGARSWSVGVSFVAEDANSALDLARNAPDVAGVRHPLGSEASLTCLADLGQHVALSLAARVQAPDNAPETRQNVQLRAAELARCANDPAHAADRDAYLAALDVGFGS